MLTFVQGIQDAFVTISLVDGKGNVMGRTQDTPVTNNLAGAHVLFNNCEVCRAGLEIYFARCRCLRSWPTQ